MKFLLIMPSYNQSHYIGQAIDSVLAQTDPDWELWIVDNSTDMTPSVVARYQDPRIKFHHIPQRMDPGTCLNWALERASVRDFSYIHTDNILAPDYVKSMRAALARDEMSLAYCDMRVINDEGVYTQVYRRGSFDLPRLVSLSPLGVPFSSTTALARVLGGFSTRDVADDVLYCLMAYGRASYVYIPDALTDYRLHEGSRTTEHGGAQKMGESFWKTYLKALPSLQQRGVDVIAALRDKIELHRNNIELSVQDVWFRRGSRTGIRLVGMPTFQVMWDIGYFKLPDFTVASARALMARDMEQVHGGRLSMLAAAQFKLVQRKIIRSVQPDLYHMREHVLTWVVLSVGSMEAGIRCWLCSFDIYSIWISQVLARVFSWKIHVTPENRGKLPAWLPVEAVSMSGAGGQQDFLLSMAKGDIYLRRAGADA